MRDELWRYLEVDAKGVLATIYLPLASGKLVSLLYTMRFNSDGRVITTENVIVRDLREDNSAAELACMTILVLILLLILFHQFMQALDELVDLAQDCALSRFLERSLGKTAAQQLLAPRKWKLALGVLMVCWAAYVMSEFDTAFAHIFTKSRGDRLLALVHISTFFLMSIVVQETTELLISGDVKGYFSDGFNYLDILTITTGIASFALLIEIATRVGDIDAKSVKNNFPPFHAYSEESIFYLAERDLTLSLMLGAMMFTLVARQFKYLSIFPTLLVPFAALRRSAKEILSFGVTLMLFIGCFAQLFMHAFGADQPEFSGAANLMNTLFTAAFDDFPDGVYDRVAEYGPTKRGLGYLAMFAFRALITISFMNMLITITMEWYGTERDKPGASQLVTPQMREYLTAWKSKNSARANWVSSRLPLHKKGRGVGDGEEQGIDMSVLDADKDLSAEETKDADPTREPPGSGQQSHESQLQRLGQAVMDMQQDTRDLRALIQAENAETRQMMNELRSVLAPGRLPLQPESLQSLEVPQARRRPLVKPRFQI